MIDDTVRRLLERIEFPRSGRYGPELILDNSMGPHPLWLLEWLTDSMKLEPGMRILDLGCGKALTSIFLARSTNGDLSYFRRKFPSSRPASTVADWSFSYEGGKIHQSPGSIL